MDTVNDKTAGAIGQFGMEVYGAGRHGRRRAARFRLRCDAIGLYKSEILLLSVAGPETSIKALAAALRSSGKDQKRIVYSAAVGTINEAYLSKCPDGYRIHRCKLDYGLWHVLCLSKRAGFMPIMSEDAVWRYLQGDSFTTPLLQSWTARLMQSMKDQGMLVEITQSGCQAGIVRADSAMLDGLVSEGVRRGDLTISAPGTSVPSGVPGRGPGSRREHITAQLPQPSPKQDIRNLDDYLLAYGPLLGRQAEQTLHPLHVPRRDALPSLDLGRTPFEAQAHVIEATRKALTGQKTILLVGEMGTGKTLMGMAAVHAHAAGQPYRALVFCPGQLLYKWEREIRQTIPDAQVLQIKTWKSLLPLGNAAKQSRAEWYIIARDRAKLGSKWQPAVGRLQFYEVGYLRCPQCGLRLVSEDRQPLALGKPAKDGQAASGLWRRRVRCEWVLTNHRGQRDSERDQGNLLVKGCGAPLWQMNGELRRYEPALFIKRHLRHFFKYLILDEIHEEKGADTAQAHAAGALAASCRKTIALTGTLIGGYAEHLRPLLFRLAPATLVREGLGWSESTAFNERYGRIETRITERTGALRGEDNRMSRGSRSITKMVRPGIMPMLFGRHLLDKTVFLGLDEVADNLPPLAEECVPVAMDKELTVAYKDEVEEPLAAALKELLQRRDRRLLGAMVQTLLAYPDHPFGWSSIGYWQPGLDGAAGKFVPVAQPPNLSPSTLRPKELALLDLVQAEKAQRRKVWVYVQYTGKHDVQGRLERLLRRAGYAVAVLQARVALAEREAWIAEHAPQLDVVISHPRLVETGLDLFDKDGRHNFPTLCFYETGYNLFTLRQAARRAWRIGQEQACRIVYLYYQGTMQERALALMGKKLTAAQALEGKFSSEGLVALAGADANVELALARSLVERMDEGDVGRMWNKTTGPLEPFAHPTISPAMKYQPWLKESDGPPLGRSQPQGAAPWSLGGQAPQVATRLLF